MNTATLFYFFLSSILIAALPGPAMMLVIQGAVKGGWRAGGLYGAELSGQADCPPRDGFGVWSAAGLYRGGRLVSLFV